MNIKKIVLLSAVLLLCVSNVYAQEVIYKLAAPLPGGEETASNFTDYAKFLFPFMLSMASILALVMFTIGAIQYMFSDGGAGNKDGKDKMANAIFGLLLAAGSVIILETINPKLITLTIDIEQRSGTAGTQNPDSCPAGGPCGGSCYGSCTDRQKTCVNKGGGPSGPYACEIPPDSCGNRCSDDELCVQGQCEPLGSQTRDCTPQERADALCPAERRCIIETLTVGGRPQDTLRCIP